ncbi:N-acetylglucosamine kinase [Evansella cellulosilytica]|uniref:ATPase BadF/BadG/BcrA/BcrD type n=1 Tax=Evansella cellulosilytica (strain ATCC 21833 / DSM 2522 / FERM P-1141 / JCM 9156 / N-4) TaxID=649639 RepID=E6TW98_EVAC2|nr:BadF/BadG/BcrA/BcrD ATPase family protein [Evansella cellulosilytica]ADU31054.1 ATPase BadF/BadG/BcrA/BcrD type [Evansella cellulosilytica DSM 2522]
MMYVMGIDGGGTKTYAVITDQSGTFIAEGIAGGGNHQSVGMDKALTEIRKAIEMALNNAKLKYSDITFVQYGLSGADRQKDFDIILPALKRLPFKEWDVVCDTMEGLRIGSDDYTGVVLVCGTGTNAAGRNKKGETIQTGGFGYFFGDFSGGGQIATEAFRRTIRSWELREQPSVLTNKVPQYLGFESVEELFHSYLDDDIYHVPAGLAKIVHEVAEEGDALANDILAESGKELGIAALSVIKRLQMVKENGNIPIVLVGSIVQKGRNNTLLRSLKETLETELTNYNIVIPNIEPVYGAIMLAMDHLRIPVTEEMKQKFEKYGGYSHEGK